MPTALVHILPAVLAVLLAHGVVCALRPALLLLRGRYRDAHRAAEYLGRSWVAIFPSVRVTSRYLAACALHYDGKLDESLSTLAMLDVAALDDNLRFAARSLEAASLVLASRDLDRARAALTEARAIRETAEVLLLLAHVEEAAGDVVGAAALLDCADRTRLGGSLRVGRTILVDDAATKRSAFHCLRALYLLQAGRVDEAWRDVEIAAAGPRRSVYADRARALLVHRASHGTADARA